MLGNPQVGTWSGPLFSFCVQVSFLYFCSCFNFLYLSHFILGHLLAGAFALTFVELILITYSIQGVSVCVWQNVCVFVLLRLLSCESRSSAVCFFLLLYVQTPWSSVAPPGLELQLPPLPRSRQASSQTLSRLLVHPVGHFKSFVASHF